MARLNTPTSHAMENHPDHDPVKMVVGYCERCGPNRPVRVFGDARQCGACGWVQTGEASDG